MNTPSKNRRQGIAPTNSRFEEIVEELVARQELQATEIRQLRQEIAELRAAIVQSQKQVRLPEQVSLEPEVLPKPTTVELVDGRVVPRTLYEDVRWKLSILLKPHLQIVASKSRNPLTVIDERNEAVHCDVARKYGIGHDFCSYREAFCRLGLLDVHGNMPDDVAAIITAATESKGTNVALRESATTEEIAAATRRNAQLQHREEQVALSWREEQSRQSARQEVLQRRQDERREEEVQRELRQALEVCQARSRLARQRRHTRNRRWIRIQRWIKRQWDEFVRS